MPGQAPGVKTSVVLDYWTDNSAYFNVSVLTRIPKVANRAAPKGIPASADPHATAAETTAVVGPSPTHFERVDLIYVNRAQPDGVSTTTADQINLAAGAWSQQLIATYVQSNPPFASVAGSGTDGTNWADGSGASRAAPVQPNQTVALVINQTSQFVEFRDPAIGKQTSGGGPVPIPA